MTETEIMLDCLVWLGAHHSPPPPGTDEAVDWWMSAAADAYSLTVKWDQHPLLMDVLCTLYAYRERNSSGKKK